MTSVVCEIIELKSPASTNGIHPTEKTVAVRSVQNRREFLQAPEHFLRKDGGKCYLPVSVIHYDRGTRAYLIELPFEADSGANRVWVDKDSVLQADEVTA